MKTFFILAGVVGLLLVGSIYWSRSLQGGVVTDITKTCVQHGGLGMHIHPELKIFINEEEQVIPANIGIPNTACMRPIHTHDNTGVIHIESVKVRDFKLQEFFNIWNRDLYSFGASVSMTVNGVENSELGDYIMHDGDRIELRYSN